MFFFFFFSVDDFCELYEHGDNLAKWRTLMPITTISSFTITIHSLFFSEENDKIKWKGKACMSGRLCSSQAVYQLQYARPSFIIKLYTSVSSASWRWPSILPHQFTAHSAEPWLFSDPHSLPLPAPLVSFFFSFFFFSLFLFLFILFLFVNSMFFFLLIFPLRTFKFTCWQKSRCAIVLQVGVLKVFWKNKTKQRKINMIRKPDRLLPPWWRPTWWRDGWRGWCWWRLECWQRVRQQLGFRLVQVFVDVVVRDWTDYARHRKSTSVVHDDVVLSIGDNLAHVRDVRIIATYYAW